MSPHQERVVDEKSQLDERLTKLAEFIDSNRIYSLLPDAEKLRMARQRASMAEYSAILAERIAAF